MGKGVLMMPDIPMPKGKFEGKLIVDIPSDYLRWVAENWEDDIIATAADEEWNFRQDNNSHFYE